MLTRLLHRQSILAVIVTTLASSFGVMVLSFFTSIITARTLGSEGRGILASFTLWLPILGALASFGMHKGFIYFSKTAPELRSQLFGWSLLASFLLSLTLAALIFPLVPFLVSSLSGSTLRNAQWFVTLAVPIIALVTFFDGISQSLLNLRLYNQIRLLVPLIYGLLLILLWQMQLLTPPSAAWSIYTANAAIALYAFVRLFWELKPRLGDLGGIARRYFSYSISVLAADVLNIFANNIDRIFIVISLSPQDIGLYAVAYSFSRTFGVLPNTLATILFPRITGRSTPAVVNNAAMAFRITSTAALLTSIPFLVGSQVLVTAVFGHEFTGSVLPFVILSIEAVLTSSTWVLAQAFSAMGHPNVIFLRQALSLAVVVIALFLFTPSYGINGVAFAFLLGAALRFLVTLVALPTVLGVPIPRLLLTRSDLRAISDRLKPLMR